MHIYESGKIFIMRNANLLRGKNFEYFTEETLSIEILFIQLRTRVNKIGLAYFRMFKLERVLFFFFYYW